MLPAVKSLAEKNYFALATAPWYFGAYLSQAQYNLTTTLNDLSKKLGSETTEDEHNLLRTRAITILTDTQAKPDEVQKAMAYYEKNLPFLFGMHFRFSPAEKKTAQKPRNISPSASGYAVILQQLIQVLHDARSHYLHADGNGELQVNQQLFYWLNDAFDINARMVKRKLQLDERESNHLRRFIANYDRTLTDKQGKPLKVIPNPAFEFYFNKKENRSAFTTYGLAFFTCLFLSAGEVYSFLRRINGFQSACHRKRKATFDTFCINALQAPKERLNIDYGVSTLITDMCNELAKAPIELFETLHPDKQKLFITREPENDDTNDYPALETKMVRKNNRFSFFAQRFLDITRAFQHIRFGVDLGYYYYSIYPKTIAGIATTRELAKRLTGYGRLEDFEKEKRPAAYRELFIDIDEKEPDCLQPYIAEAWPHYHTENNLIPLAWTDGTDAYWPSLQTASTNGQKSYPNKYIKAEDSQKPIAWLSVFELPALLLYELIQQDISAEKIIADHIAGIKQFFNNIKAGTIQPVSDTLIPKPAREEIFNRSNAEYNNRWKAVMQMLHTWSLKPAYIPEKLLTYLLGIAPAADTAFHEKAAGRLQTMISECRQAIYSLDLREKEEIKPGKKSFRKIVPGKLAEALATDMLLLQPPLKDENGNNICSSKPNSTAFRLLQSHLAFFAEHRHQLAPLFKACRLTGSPNAHPFLQNMQVQEYSGLTKFYKGYFTEKINWLEKCVKEKNYADYHFLKLQGPGTDIINLVDTYLNTNNDTTHTACNLPRGLFYDAAIQYFKQHGSAAMKDYVRRYETTGNAIHLINYYFKHECKDASQDFYRWPRQYDVFKEPFEKDGWNGYYTSEERAARWEGVKNATVRDKSLLIQQRLEAEQELQEFKKEVRGYRDLRAIARLVIEKFGNKYPDVKKIQVIRFKDFEIPRKIITKVAACIDDTLKSAELKARAFRLCKEKEQYLRLTEVQDKLLFLCIKKLAGNSEYRLQQVTAPNDAAGNKSILHYRPANGIAITHPFYKVTDTGDFEKHNKRRVQAGEVIIADKQGTINHIGQFRKLIKDKRLNNLCFYFQPDSSGNILLSKQITANELQEYDLQRLAVLEIIAEFETKLFEKHGQQAASFFYANGIQQHRRYLAYYFARYDAGNEKLQIELNAVRTGFLYNRFPFINNQRYRLSADEWTCINNNHEAIDKGQPKGYGIIQKIAAATINQYAVMIHTLEAV